MSRFIPIQEVVDLPLLGSGDYLKRNKGRLLKWAKYVYTELNLSVIKVARREVIHINKKTNSIQLPENCFQLSSVNLIDDKTGEIFPVWRSDTIHDDLVDISASKDCACEHKCGYSLCNTVKGYEAIVSVKSDTLPTGNPISFNCVDRKVVDPNGFFYSETQFPQRIYENGVWVNTILYTEQKKLCKVEVDKNGCICDTEENLNTLCTACGIQTESQNGVCVGGNAASFHDNPQVNTWIYHRNSMAGWFNIQCGCNPHGLRSFRNIYNLNELQNRIEFPHSFGFSKVLIRYYTNVDLANMQIPIIAVPTFVMGLKWWDVRFDDKKQNLEAKYNMDYSKSQWGLIGELNKYRIKELRMIATPPVFMPSYIDHRKDRQH